MSILSNWPMRLPGPLPTRGTELGGSLLVLGGSTGSELSVGSSEVLVGVSVVAGPEDAAPAAAGVPAVLLRNAPMANAVTTPARARTTTTAVITRARRPVRRDGGGVVAGVVATGGGGGGGT